MKVSVAVITYNQERYIAQAIESALAQKTGFDFEIVVGDDASTDRTAGIVQQYAEKFPGKVRAILHPGNKGFKKNFIAVAEACRGEYLTIIEGDDYWTDPLKLQTQVDFLENNRDYSICFHDVTNIYDDGREPDSYMASAYPWVIREGRTDFELEDILRQNIIPTVSVMYRGILPEGFTGLLESVAFGDWLLHTLHARSGKIRYLNVPMGVYRNHAMGYWTSAASEYKMMEILKFRMQIDRYLEYRYTGVLQEAILNEYATVLKYNSQLLQGREWHEKESAEKERYIHQLVGVVEKLEEDLRESNGRLAQKEAALAEVLNSKVFRFGGIFAMATRSGRDFAMLPLRLAWFFLPYRYKCAFTEYVRKAKNSRWPSPRPLVSMIITGSSGADAVKATMQSISIQTFSKYEVILVDGSPECATVMEEIQETAGIPVKAVNSSSGGASGAKNAGIREAAGRYICCLDAGDRLAPTYLEKCVVKLEYQNLDIVYCDTSGLRGGTVKAADKFYLEKLLGEAGHMSVPASAVFRVSLWARAGGYRDDVAGRWGHWDLWIRAALKGALGEKIYEKLVFPVISGSELPDGGGDEASGSTRSVMDRYVNIRNNKARVDKITARQHIRYRVLGKNINLLCGAESKE